MTSSAEGVIASMEDDVRGYRVWWDEANDIGRVDWTPGVTVRLPEAQSVLAEMVALGRGKVPVLVDARGAGTMDRPARELFKHSEDGFASTAILVGSAVNRMVANFFLGRNQTSAPVKMFTLEAEAVSWLQTQP